MIREELKAPSTNEYIGILEKNLEPEPTYKHKNIEFKYLVCNYKNFQLSTPHIGQFIASKDGKPLVKPDGWEEYLKDPTALHDYVLMMEYQKAESEVIYQGFEVEEDENCLIVIKSDNKEVWYSTASKIFQAPYLGFINTHEDIQKLGVYFTVEFAKKMKTI